MKRMLRVLSATLAAVMVMSVYVTPAAASQRIAEGKSSTAKQEIHYLDEEAKAVMGRGASAEVAPQITETVESEQAAGSDNETLTASAPATKSATVENSDPAISTDAQPTDTEQAAGSDNETLTASAPATESATVENSDPATSTSEGMQDLNNSLVSDADAASQIDTAGIVMQSTDYSCGPAALATVLQNMGISVTEGELKVLAGTDTSGTSMYGLKRAAQAKGLRAVGMRLSIDDLRANMIVHVIINGEGHYSVIRKVTEESVYLADPSKGNIRMSREEFSEIYTGSVLEISASREVDQTEAVADQANTTDTGIAQSENSQVLTAETMQDIRGKGGRNRITRHWWGFRVYLSHFVTQSIVNGKLGAVAILGILGVSIKVASAIALSTAVLSQVNIRNRGVRVWFTHSTPLGGPRIFWVDAQR